MKRKIDYLFQPSDSRMWYIRFQGKPRIERSLGTPDRVQADLLALPLIAEHKARLLAKRPHFTKKWRHELEPGREHAGPDGGKIVATDTLLIHIGHNGNIIKTVPNGGPAFALEGGPLTIHSLARATLDADFGDGPAERPTVATKNGDDELIELYLREQEITGPQEKQMRDTWALWKEICPGVRLKDATRVDGRKLRDHLRTMKGRRGDKVKSSTVMHKIAQLVAACNFAIAEGRLKNINPFSGIARKGDDVSERHPFTDADMKVIWRNLDKLNEADRLLVRVLASTGMRIDEAFQINGEKEPEQGIRYVRIGTKSKASKRRVPFPAVLLPYLPDKIEGRLFAGGKKGSHNASSSRLNPWLREIGFDTEFQPVHALRHRAEDKLRDVKSQVAGFAGIDIRRAVLGQAHGEGAAGTYGDGFPIAVLKRWIDQIGF